jgi:AMP deaminase
MMNGSIELPLGDFHRVIVNGDDGDPDYLACADRLAKAVLMRDAYKDVDKGQLEDYAELDATSKLIMEDGIFRVVGLRTNVVLWSTYIANMKALFDLLEVGTWLSVCKTRLTVLEEKFELYALLNGDVEAMYDEKTGGGGLFGPSVRVDNSVKLSTGMTAQVLVDYIHETVKSHGHENIKLLENGQPITLKQVLEEMGVEDATKLTAEGLGLHPAQRKRFNEFDILDPNLTKAETAEILQLFLQPQKTLNNGRFYAGLVRPMLEAHEREANNKRGHPRVVTEYKFPLTGARPGEWVRMADWLKDNLSVSYSCNRWVVQIQRRANNRQDSECVTVEDQLRNIFEPLFRATLSPVDEYAALAEVLKSVGAINVTSDEAFRRRNLHTELRPPATIRWEEDMPDDYYFFYYVWANLCMLNALRKKLGLNTIQFRPTCGESTPHWDQLVCSYLLADSVAQGIKLADSWVLQYLYMIGRIGLCVSPLSNNAACFSYFENPFLAFYKRGLLVSLATDDPLHYHHGTEPLLEEYATAQTVYHLTPTDMSELARNSVLISSFADEQKLEWIGSLGWEGGGSHKSNLCDFRLHFRHDCLLHEQALMNYVLEQQHAALVAKGKASGPPPLIVARFAKTTVGRGPADSQPDRRKNYTDRRVAYPRISVGNRISDPKAHRPSVMTIGDMLARRNKYYDPILSHAAKCRRIRIEDVFRKDGKITKDPDTSDGEEDAQGDMASPHTLTLASRAGAAAGAASTVSFIDTPQETMFDAQSPPSRTHAAVRFLRPGEEWNPDNWVHAMYYGVCLISRLGTAPDWPAFVPEIREFVDDVRFITDVAQNDVMLDILARLRLNLLEHRYRLHLGMNIGREAGNLKEKENNNRDFYTARKVDNNVHTDASMNARLLFHFFTDKVRHAGHDVVMERDSVPVTLRQLVLEEGITNIERLTVDELTTRLTASSKSVKGGAGNSELHDVFLTVNNYMGGRYFAELTKLVLENNKQDENSFSEMRLEVRGESPTEWNQLAQWFDRYGMATSQNRWVIRMPRNYAKLRAAGKVKDFGEFLENLFSPLWEVSLRPAEHTKTHYLLSYISGFDCVGDETEVDLELTAATAPHEWRRVENPPFSYYMYYLWANIVTLNDFRHKRGLSLFNFRPHCGEAGGIEHLAAGFMVSSSISHGITLNKSPVMEYLFYVSQVGVTMSPLSNTEAAIAYLDNPFPKFFQRGLNVSLSTNIPLRFHFTSEPLIEEYSIAAKIWVLSTNDLSELSRNSVLISGFPRWWKKEALGPLFKLKSTLGNDVRRSHVSDIRVAYRYEVYHTELDFLDSILAAVDDDVKNRSDLIPATLLDHAVPKLPRAMLLLTDEVKRYELQTGMTLPDPDSPDGMMSGSPLDKLKMQIESIKRAIADNTKDLHDYSAQNRSLAVEILRLKKRADDAQGDATVLRANFNGDYESPSRSPLM